MARIRTLKPEFWTHEDLSALPEPTHMLAAALLNYADDEGYFNANLGLIKAACSPLREPSVSLQDSLVSLARIAYLQLGTGSDGKRYGRIAKFGEHQVVNRPTASKIKAMEVVWESSESAHGKLSEHSLPEGKGKEQGKEGKGSTALRAEPAPPKAKSSKPKQEPLPTDFAISERVRAWAAKKGFGDLDEHLESFRRKCSAKGYIYADWDDAFMEAIREDWAKLRKSPSGGTNLFDQPSPAATRRLG